MKKILLHIGKHKTGSTSFQLFLRKSKKSLHDSGIYPLPHRVGNRLAALAIRDNLPIPPLLDCGGKKPSPDSVLADLTTFTTGQNVETFLITSEHLSYLRTLEEVQKVKDCLPPSVEVEVFLVLRNRHEFLVSYRDQITSSGHGPVEDPNSPYYCGADAWIVDDETLIACWEALFPKVNIVQYQKEGMIKALGSAMKLPENILNHELRLNTNSPYRKRLKSALRKILKATPLGHSGLRAFRRWKWG